MKRLFGGLSVLVLLAFAFSRWTAGQEPIPGSGGAGGGPSTGPCSTAGAVFFGPFSCDASNFFWDATNHRLGLGTNFPNSKLRIFENTNGNLAQIGNASDDLFISADASNFVRLRFPNGGTAGMKFESSAGAVATLTAAGQFAPTTFGTATNCSSSAAPAVCGSSAAGSVVVAAAATTVTVNTTAVTANSQIKIQFDSSLGSKLSVTCNVTPPSSQPYISARTAGTSFTITSSAPVTNPACFSYDIVN